MASQSFTELVSIDGSNGKQDNFMNFTSKAHPNRGESYFRWILIENPEGRNRSIKRWILSF
jgi:hypothetical protein